MYTGRVWPIVIVDRIGRSLRVYCKQARGAAVAAPLRFVLELIQTHMTQKANAAR